MGKFKEALKDFQQVCMSFTENSVCDHYLLVMFESHRFVFVLVLGR
ncbi:hypothetical protein Hanom_Chr03g00227021 [Helianthus anomalus]